VQIVDYIEMNFIISSVHTRVRDSVKHAGMFNLNKGAVRTKLSLKPIFKNCRSTVRRQATMFLFQL
jgi:hypothetical protein